ncbi:DNA topoisomerase IB [Alteromonas halophila]|uniref:DNA topoisomerase n=1 Tax=Alteromonas halophila TaxID=516698 RepID=A0A918MZ38_9ALTE|nr:DNA topoisomerase IB [Alteromonas halophila]GGW87714.1 hypothetical protein GCM10007391_21800 [Alteromonas halophila]
MALSENEAIRRCKRGRGFEYFYATGNKVGCRRTLQRIKRLVIPPQWQQVLINPKPSARIQAEGLDRKHRRQYIYHPSWHEQQQQQKFSDMTDFGRCLPEFRQHCWQLLKREQWTLKRSAALACLLLDHTGLRAGNRQYTQSNQTYGLTTLRRRHLHQEGDRIRLRFTGKHHRERDVVIDDPALADLVCESAEKQGYALFRYQADGHWHDIDSDDVNAFIHTHLSDRFSCKDFRTWSASRFAVHSLPVVNSSLQQNVRRKWSPTLTQHVADMLGNTPQICRKYYLHPKLITAIESPRQRKQLLSEVGEIMHDKRGYKHALSSLEKVLIQVIS